MRIGRSRGMVVEEVFLRFSEREKRVLREASAIAKLARGKARSVVGPRFEDDPMDTLLAEVEYNPSEFLDGISLEWQSVAL